MFNHAGRRRRIDKHHQHLISKARKLLLTEKVELQDFNQIKNEYKLEINSLNNRLIDVDNKLLDIQCSLRNMLSNAKLDIFRFYTNLDIAGKRHIINLFTPSSIDPVNKTLGELEINEAVSKVIYFSDTDTVGFSITNNPITKNLNSYKSPQRFSNRSVTTDKAISILKRNGIQANEDQAKAILDFLYRIAQTVPQSSILPVGPIPQEEIEHQSH